MKKLFMMAFAVVSAMALTVSCDSDYAPDSFLDEAKVSSSYVAIDVNGGSSTIELTANGSWEIANGLDWLTVSPMSGSAGNSTITFSAASTMDGRNGAVTINVGGKSQYINVIQGLSTVAQATCAEVIAGPDSKTYLTKGIVTAITNTTYGNFYINDGTGEVYIYGTLYAGKTQNNPIKNNNIEVGDEITVQGPKTTYNGVVELVDVTVVKVAKSLIKCDSTYVAGVPSAELPIEGGEITAYLTNKGNGLFVDVPADAQSWLSISQIAGNTVTFKAQPNDGGDRSTTLVFKTTDGKKDYSTEVAISQKGAVVAVTCQDFNSKEDGEAQYKVRGIVTNIANTKYGNLYINDGTGEVYVYGITDWANYSSTLKVGDEVELQSVKTSHKGAAQMKNAIVNELVAHDVLTVESFLATEESKTAYYVLSGTVVASAPEGSKVDLATYGNFTLKDETGEVYVYGVLNNMLEKKSKQFGTLGVKEGDKITILGYHTSYKGVCQVGGAIFIKNEPAAAE